MKRLLMDFNSLSSAPEDLAKFGHTDHLECPLTPGERVQLYDDEFMVEAVVLYDAEHDYWLAQPDWSTRQPTPPELAATIH